MKYTMKLSAAPRGFTLVELLVTILIILVIAALAAVGTHSGRETAVMATAMGRIKALGLANASYAVDHNGRYVPITTADEAGGGGLLWHHNRDFLRDLLGELPEEEVTLSPDGIVGIPESALDPMVVKSRARLWDRLPSSFGYNFENVPGYVGIGPPNSTAQHSVESIASPSETFSFITATDGLVQYESRFEWLNRPEEGKTENGQIAYRYKGRAIAMFYDNHTELLSPQDLQKFDASSGVSSRFWGGSR